MTGREKFKIFKPILTLAAATLSLAPRSVTEIIWLLVRGFPGKIGVVLRYVLAKTLCKGCGDSVMIAPGTEIKHWENLILGSNVSIHNNCYLDAIGGIHIGDNTSIAHQCSILSFDHTYEDLEKPIKYNPLRMNPVILKSDIWVGCGVRILAGCTIESRSILAAGSVVKAGIYESGIYAGVPAKQKKILRRLPIMDSNTNIKN